MSDVLKQVNYDVADTVIEDTTDFVDTDQAQDQLEMAGQDVDNVADAMGSMEQYMTLLETAGTDGINAQSAAFLRVGLEMIANQAGIKLTTASLEGYETATPRDGRRQVTVSKEELSEAAKKLGKRIWEALKALWAKAKELYNRWFGKGAQAQKKTQYLLTVIPKFPGYPGAPFKQDIPMPPSGVKSTLPAIVKSKVGKAANDDEDKTIEIGADVAKHVYFQGKPNLKSSVIEKTLGEFIFNEYEGLMVKAADATLALAKATKGSTLGELPEKLFAQIKQIMAPAARLNGELPGGGKIVFKEMGFEYEADDSSAEAIKVEVRGRSEIERSLKSANEVFELIHKTTVQKGLDSAAKTFEKALERIDIIWHNGTVDGKSASNATKAIAEVAKAVISNDAMAEAVEAIMKSLVLKTSIYEKELAQF